MEQVRCGICCRVSVVEASDPEQNSIETQRSICEHYVEVQREKGWEVVGGCRCYHRGAAGRT